MKTWKHGIIGILAIIALAFTACDNVNKETHTHEWEWVVTTPATFNTDGEETGTCTTCGATSTRPIVKLSPISSLEGIVEYLTSLPANTAVTPYDLILSNIDIADLTEGNDPLGKLFASFDEKYVNLDLSNCNLGESLAMPPNGDNNRANKDKIISLKLPPNLITIGNMFRNLSSFLI